MNLWNEMLAESLDADATSLDHEAEQTTSACDRLVCRELAQAFRARADKVRQGPEPLATPSSI